MYLIFTYVIREVVNKIRFLSQVVLYSFNIIRNTLYDLIFYKKNKHQYKAHYLKPKFRPTDSYFLPICLIVAQMNNVIRYKYICSVN